MLTNHDRFVEAFKDMPGAELKTTEIRRILKAKFPEMSEGSILPNDHASGNASPCWCANKEQRVFDRIGPGLYRVGPNIISSQSRAFQNKSTEIPKAVSGKKMKIIDLWNSQDEQKWKKALESYWSKVKAVNLSVEKELDGLNVAKPSDINDWYSFLLDKYIPWKYTDPRFLPKRKEAFATAYQNNRTALATIVNELFSFDKKDMKAGLVTARKISGLGPAGASGLLAILFPKYFGTIDQFVARSLCSIEDLPEKGELARIDLNSLTIENGVVLVGIMRRKASELNRKFNTDFWTPRKIDMVLWGVRD